METPFTTDEIRAALRAAGIPEDLHPTFIQFQLAYGGFRTAFWLSPVCWGILHREPEWMEPGIVMAEPDDRSPEIWHVHCADVHPSDTMTMDQHGRLYWCWRLRYNHYEDYFARKPPLTPEEGGE